MIKTSRKKPNAFSLKILGFVIGVLLCCSYTSYAQTTIFYQNFDGTYGTVSGSKSISIAGSSCIPQAQTWIGAESGTYGYFYRDDKTVGGGYDICGGSYQAPGCTEAGSYCLYFDGFDAANNVTGTIESPNIDLSSYTGCYTVTLSFYFFNEDETSVEVLFSNNGGTSFTSQGTITTQKSSWQTASYTIILRLKFPG